MKTRIQVKFVRTTKEHLLEAAGFYAKEQGWSERNPSTAKIGKTRDGLWVFVIELDGKEEK